MRNATVMAAVLAFMLPLGFLHAEEPAPAPKLFSARTPDGITVTVTHDLKITARDAHQALLWAADWSVTIRKSPHHKGINRVVRGVTIQDGEVLITQGSGKTYIKLKLADGSSLACFAAPEDVLPPEPIPLLAPAAPHFGQPAAVPSPKELDHWLKALESSDFETRENAQHQLIRGGSEVLPLLEAALKQISGEKPELQERIKRLCTSLRAGAVCGTALHLHKPVEGARVLLFRSVKDFQEFLPLGQAQTDASGNFSLGELQPGAYFISIDQSTGRGSSIMARLHARVETRKTTKLKVDLHAISD